MIKTTDPMAQVNQEDFSDVKNLFIANLNGVSNRSIFEIACLLTSCVQSFPKTWKQNLNLFSTWSENESESSKCTNF